MTMTSIRSVGYCFHRSQQGDWAFEYAFELARSANLALKVFHFLADPYDPSRQEAPALPHAERTRLAIERERDLRSYFDERLGDYLNVGFRVCEDHGWRELHRCLTHHEFQVLVLARPENGAMFAGKPLEEFADAFVCPVVLIGPSAPTEFRLNSPARLIADKLGLPSRLRQLFRNPCMACAPQASETSEPGGATRD